MVICLVLSEHGTTSPAIIPTINHEESLFFNGTMANPISRLFSRKNNDPSPIYHENALRQMIREELRGFLPPCAESWVSPQSGNGSPLPPTLDLVGVLRNVVREEMKAIFPPFIAAQADLEPIQTMLEDWKGNPGSDASDARTETIGCSEEFETSMVQRIDALVATRIDALRDQLAPALEQQIRDELSPKYAEEMRNKHEEECLRLDQKASLGKLLIYLCGKSGMEIGQYVDQLPAVYKMQAVVALRETLSENVRASMMQELRVGISNDVDHPAHQMALQLLIANPTDEIRNRVVDQLEAYARTDDAHKFWSDLIGRMIANPTDEIRNRVVDQLEACAMADDAHELWSDLIGRLAANDDFRAQAEQRALDVACSKLRSEIDSDTEHPLKQQAVERLTNNPAIRDQTVVLMRQELLPGIKFKVKAELRETLRAELEHELRLPILYNRDGEIEDSVSSVVRRQLEAAVNVLREDVLNEVWKFTVKAICEGLAATDLLEPESWRSYVKLASELIDDRIAPLHKTPRRKLKTPDGFYRAIESVVCHRTQETIETGEYYLVFRGRIIGLPLTEDGANRLVQQTEDDESYNEDAEVGAVDFPWSGLPWNGDGPAYPHIHS